MKPSEKPFFEQRGLKGYSYPLDNDAVEMYHVDVTQGHDTYIISKKCTHIYYVLEGSGTFDIDGEITTATKDAVIEVLPGSEYTYSGTMKLLLIMNPPWFEGNETITRDNSRVN